MEKIKFGKLPRDVQDVLREITAEADRRKVSVWLVGGMVRDLLLGQPSLDVDIVVEGDGMGFAAALARGLGARALIHRRFGTAAIELASGLRIDVVTARREMYARPGSLPDVIFGQLSDDLFRRDFTINAIAASLNSADLGEIRDDFEGAPDIAKGLVRIMHYRSFVDDPTRILRAIRYEKRFNFRLEVRTLSALKTACHEDAFMTITPVRYFNEFQRILQERDPLPAMRRLRSLDALRYFSFTQAEERLLDKIVRSQATTFSSDVCPCEAWIPRMAGLLSFLDPKRAENLLTLFNISKGDRQKIHQFLHFLSVPDMLDRLKQREFAIPPRKKAS